jgi:chemotaxis protein methyltransferase CheR
MPGETVPVTMQPIQQIQPIRSTITLPQVTDSELVRFAELIYARTGIRVSPQKKMLLSNRLRRRLRDTGLETFSDYYRHLVGLPAQHAEWDAFLQEITTHETFLFRDENQWNWFRRYLAELSASGRRPPATGFRVWSAACSTGDEPVTIACSIVACLRDYASWRPYVLGTDIGLDTLRKAKAAVFGERAMRLVPAEYRGRYFARVADGAHWQARSALTELIAYRQHNLLEPMRERNFDVVFLKNVLIYFDGTSKQRVMGHVRAALCPGGLLVAGAAEGVGDLVRDYERLQPWLYRKTV